MLAIVAVAKLVMQKMADYQGRQGGQPQSSSLLHCCKAARVQQCMPNTCISYNINDLFIRRADVTADYIGPRPWAMRESVGNC